MLDNTKVVYHVEAFWKREQPDDTLVLVAIDATEKMVQIAEMYLASDAKFYLDNVRTAKLQVDAKDFLYVCVAHKRYYLYAADVFELQGMPTVYRVQNRRKNNLRG